MAELLLELFSEEIPARMQARASEELKRGICTGLASAGLTIGTAQAYATPRRLVVVIDDIPSRSPAVSEERRGPRVGAAEKAIAGFLRGVGLESIEQADVIADQKKGDFYLARITTPGRDASDIVSEVVRDVCTKFPWPKSMRWGSSDFSWVRPLHSVVCLLGGKVVPFCVGNIETGDVTRGHRFHGPAPFRVENFEDYGTKLLANKVLLPTSERAAAIAEQAKELAQTSGLMLVADDALTNENAGLTEWPTVLMGTFDADFLDVPPECLITSMKAHQKCFSLRDPATGNLANRFLAVTNLEAPDGGDQIIAGNEKVIRARLSDAKFFWEQDLQRPLDEMATSLSNVTFHEKLGSQKDRVERISELAAQLAPSVDADPQKARRAAQLCKADLMSEMVGEFPELQGLMGRYYAERAGAEPAIARAIEDHYRPKGAGDDVPIEPVPIAVAVADKMDTLLGFWMIAEKPTGSGDPFQLRRAALGIIRIALENDLRLPLLAAMKAHAVSDRWRGARGVVAAFDETAEDGIESKLKDLLSFFADRLKVHLRDDGMRHDLIDAVFALKGQDDIALIAKRVEALADFLQTDDGQNLLAGTKRAANILTIEENRDGVTYDGKPEGGLLREPEERALEAAIAKVKFDTGAAIDVENFAGAMRALAELRAPVDAFFERVKVNSDDPAVRRNRLNLLAEIRMATLTVADFSKIAGSSDGAS
ncbi:MAG: glycine--tRNA ligase subunit beta [Hyphomicrobiaceae bacterium]